MGRFALSGIGLFRGQAGVAQVQAFLLSRVSFFVFGWVGPF